jgi:hypothetical protein
MADLPRSHSHPVYNPRRPQGKARFFSRRRRVEIGMHHHISGQYLATCASEMAWREGNRRVSNGGQYIHRNVGHLNELVIDIDQRCANVLLQP